jgi:integrase
MPVRKRGGIWYVRLQIRGERIERAAGPRREDARTLEAQLRQQALDERLGRRQERTLADAILTWLNGEARALRSYDNLVDKVRAMREHVAGQPLSAAVAVANTIKREGMAAGLRPATINRRLAILRRVCRLAVRWGWIEHAPSITLLPGEEPRQVMLTPTQVDQLALAAGGRVRDAIILAAYTGLREGELLELEPHQYVDGALVIARSKTGRPRVVPLPERARAIAERLPLGLDYKELRRGFEAARTAAGMEWAQFRDLRRTYGSWIVQRTGSLKAAQDLLGHTSSAITSRHYAHLLTEHLEAAVATLDAPAVGQKRGKRSNDKAGRARPSGA